MSTIILSFFIWMMWIISLDSIEQESRDIIHIVLVDKRETNKNSVILEECFIRTMDAILPEMHITEDDTHPQMTSLLSRKKAVNILKTGFQWDVCNYKSCWFFLFLLRPWRYKTWGLQHCLDICHEAKDLEDKLRYTILSYSVTFLVSRFLQFVGYTLCFE